VVPANLPFDTRFQRGPSRETPSRRSRNQAERIIMRKPGRQESEIQWLSLFSNPIVEKPRISLMGTDKSE